jgi:hypothetical protein
MKQNLKSTIENMLSDRQLDNQIIVARIQLRELEKKKEKRDEARWEYVLSQLGTEPPPATGQNPNNQNNLGNSEIIVL